jgi:GTP-binding protein
MFIDRANITVCGGNGGSGSEAMRRETGVPRGGPAGGDGGRGGSVVLVAEAQLSTLLDLTYRQQYKADRGLHGAGNDKTGRSGVDLEIPVPPGSVVHDVDTEELLGEMLEPGDRLVVAKGGRGGRGNAHFATPTRQTPRHWESGEYGQERRISIELKLIADVGLVGQPNAGKSTFLSVTSKARPKVADYPFTTLAPNLGVVELSGFRTFVIADIPGIIEGAHEGKGLGLRFLQHIERTRVLAFMVPSDSPDIEAEYKALRNEVSQYSPALAERPHLLVRTKADLDPEGHVPEVSEAIGSFSLSAVTREGVPEFLEALWAATRALDEDGAEPEAWRP